MNTTNDHDRATEPPDQGEAPVTEIPEDVLASGGAAGRSRVHDGPHTTNDAGRCVGCGAMFFHAFDCPTPEEVAKR